MTSPGPLGSALLCAPSLPGTLQPGDAREEPPSLLAVPRVTRNGDKEPPRGAARTLWVQGELLEPAVARGVLLGRPRLHPLSTRSILAPIDGRFPAGEGRCCPAGQEKWLFAEPGAGSSIDLSVPRQRSIRPVISRAQSAAGAWAGRGAGKCQAGRGCPRARDARELPGSHFPLCTSTDLSLPQFPTAELGLRLFQPDWESGDCPGAVKASWQPRGWAHPPDGNVCLSIPSELSKERERAGQERGCPGG